MARKQWVFDPDHGGVKVPAAVKRRTEERIRRYAEAHFAGCYTRLDVRFRGQFCYIDNWLQDHLGDPDANAFRAEIEGWKRSYLVYRGQFGWGVFPLTGE